MHTTVAVFGYLSLVTLIVVVDEDMIASITLVLMLCCYCSTPSVVNDASHLQRSPHVHGNNGARLDRSCRKSSSSTAFGGHTVGTDKHQRHMSAQAESRSPVSNKPLLMPDKNCTSMSSASKGKSWL